MPADAASPLTFAVGDIHGCLDKLSRLMAACEAHAGGRAARYVFLGDYIDRGPQSRGVIELLMRRQAGQPGTIVCLRGNHEQMAIDAHASERAVPLWLANNGASTLRNYGGGRISPEHLDWLAALPFCHDDGLRFFVHAGIDLDLPLAEQAPEVMVWMREPFLTYCDEVDCGRFIVHGHTPLRTGTPDLRRRRLNLDTAAVMGGPLSAAVFDDTQAQPLGFLNDRDAQPGRLAETTGTGGARR
ncbi:MAG TPA: metallophosphoesterase family protein [Xanthobacteraceae bacterium]|nr:metallophosphoesterase family protein [Xanthobacteraceae bacterium]